MIQVNNLSVSYNQTSILKNLDFSIEKGDFVLILGANGSGKSTLLNVISGIVPYILSGFNVKGNIQIENEKLTKSSFQNLKNNLGLLMHNPEDQFIGLNVKQEIELGLNFISSISKKKKFFNDIVENFGLEEIVDNSTEHLSMGQKQKVILATLLAKSPKILLLDEPTSFLDENSLKWLIQKLEEIKEKEITVLLCTHDFTPYFAISNKVLAIKNGELEFLNPIDSVTNEDLRNIYSLSSNQRFLHVNEK